MEAYGGMDIGASNVKGLVTNRAGRILGEARRRTPQGPDGTAVGAGVAATLKAACRDAEVQPADLAGVGVAAAGIVDDEAGVVETVPNLPASVGRIPLRAPLADRIGDGRVRVLNDATAGVLGQRTFGEHDHDDLVYLTISTGIGAGICVDGRVLRGHTGNAGEVGHMVVDPSGAMTCGCGGSGHWEAYCSGANLPRYARHLYGELDLDTTLPLDTSEVDAPMLFERADDDPLAAATLERAGTWNAAGVATLTHAYDPEAIYFGGGVALGNPERVLAPIRERVPDLVVREPPRLQVTPLGEGVVVRGALASVLPDGGGGLDQRERHGARRQAEPDHASGSH